MNTNQIYHNFLIEILTKGTVREPSRDQEEGTITAFSKTSPMMFDLSQGVPAVSTKKLWIRGIVEELLWFLRGDTNIRSLREKGVHFWDVNAYRLYDRSGGTYDKATYMKLTDSGVDCTVGGISKFGDLNRMYGYQWRKRRVVSLNGGVITIDALAEVVDMLLNNPNSRQIVLNTYDIYDSKVSALPPCHTMPLIFETVPLSFAERVSIAHDLIGNINTTLDEEDLETLLIPKYRLNAEMIQRSGDAFLGVPFNITSTSLLVLILADITNMASGILSHRVVNAHIYTNHLDVVKEQLQRDTDVPSSFDYSIVWGEDAFVPDSLIVNYESPYLKELKAKMVV